LVGEFPKRNIGGIKVKGIYKYNDTSFINGNSLEKKWNDYWLTNMDLVIMDPPFNIADKGKVTKTHGKIYSNREAWGDEFKDQYREQEYIDLLESFVKRAFSILSDGGSLVCFIDRRSSGHFIEIAERTGFLYKNLITFVKVNCVPKVRATNFGSATEIAVWLIKPNSGRTPSGGKVARTKPRIFNNEKAQKGLRLGNNKLDIQRYHNTHSSNVFFYTIGSKRTGHPCEKYTGQLEPIIRHLSKEQDKGGGFVVDLCAGGFNSGQSIYWF
jgi:site-specific DNA-methyltransferase (adenine-specific)